MNNIETAIEIVIETLGSLDALKHSIIVALTAKNNKLETHSDDLATIGLLHDVIEDSDWTIDMIRDKGFSNHVIEAIDAISRRKNELYNDYIMRVSLNKMATAVKLADLKHNHSRPGITTLKKRYEKAIDFLYEQGEN